MSYTFLDAAASVQTVDSSVISGSVQRPIVNIGSVLTSLPVTFSGSPSVSGTVDIGIVPGSVVAFQGTNPWTVVSSIAGGIFPISGSVAATVTNFPTNQSVSGTVVTTQLAGSVMAISGTITPSGNQSVSGTVTTTQSGTVISSVVGSVPSSLLTGVHGHRNDAIASFLGGNLTWNPLATDSAGRVLTKPLAAEESRIEGYVALTSTSLTTLVAAAGAGLKNYITDLWFANTGATTTLVTLSDSAGSILGYTIAPTVSGSNLPGLVTPIRTSENASFNIQAGSNTSTLYATVKGFKAP